MWAHPAQRTGKDPEGKLTLSEQAFCSTGAQRERSHQFTKGTGWSVPTSGYTVSLFTSNSQTLQFRETFSR